MYSYEQYLQDLNDPTTPHLETRERFKAFYEHLGKGPAKSVEYTNFRTDWITPAPTGHVLELGSHAGYNLIHWGSLHPALTLTGVDISTTLLDEAKRRIAQHPHIAARTTLIESFIEDLQLSDRFTDIVLTETLEHVQDPIPVIDSAIRHMKSGTRLWITTPSTRWGNYSHVRGITAIELEEWLCRHLDQSEISLLEERSGITWALAIRS